jgi:serine/threonine protein kinase
MSPRPLDIVAPVDSFREGFRGKVRFGLAEAAAADRQRMSLARIRKEGSLHVQTLGYRAPEVLFGDDHYGPAIDVWSLGIMVCDMTGDFALSRPRNAQSPADYVRAILSRFGIPGSSVLSDLPLYPKPVPRMLRVSECS